jgi:hypothetical protein
MLSPVGFEQAVKQIPPHESPQLNLYDFNKTKDENSRLGFSRNQTMRITPKKNAVELNTKTTAGYSPGSDYPLESCPPAELSSVSPDHTKLNIVN